MLAVAAFGRLRCGYVLHASRCVVCDSVGWYHVSLAQQACFDLVHSEWLSCSCVACLVVVLGVDPDI